MIAHKVLKKEYGNHIINDKIDTIETLIRYICNVNNVTNIKLLIGNKNVIKFIEREFPLEVDGEIQIANKKFTYKELNHGIRNELYFIRNKKQILNIIKEFFSDNQNKIKENKLLIGIVKDINIDILYNTIKELLDYYSITNYEIYVYEGISNE